MALFDVLSSGNTIPNLGGLVSSKASSKIYALRGASGVSVFNEATKGVGTNIAMSGTGASVFSPDGSVLYVHDGSAIKAINTATDTISSTISGIGSTIDLAINPAGTILYAAQEGSQRVQAINISSGTITANYSGTYYIGDSPRGVAVNPVDSKIWISSYGSSAVAVLNTDGSQAAFITSNISYAQPGMVFNSTGTRCYVASGGNGVAVINTSTYAVTLIPLSNAWEVAITPDNKYVFAVRWNGSLYVIDTATNTIVNTIAIPGRTYNNGLALNKSGSRLYVFDAGDSTFSVIETGVEASSGFFAFF